MTSSTNSAEADVPQLSGSRAVVGATWSQPPKGGWRQRDQLAFSPTLLRYLVWPKFYDPNLLSSFFSLQKFADPFLILLTLIILLMLCGDIESNPGPTLGDGYTPNAASLLGFGDLTQDPFGGIDLDHEYAIEDSPEQIVEEDNTVAFAAAISVGVAQEAGEGADSDIQILETILWDEGRPTGNDGPIPEPVRRKATKKYTFSVFDTECATCEAQFGNFVLRRKHANSCKAPWEIYAQNPDFTKCEHCHAPIIRRNIARHYKSFHSPEALATTRVEYNKNWKLYMSYRRIPNVSQYMVVRHAMHIILTAPS